MKTVVITGGTRGLGLELAKCFRKNDFNIAVCGTRQENIDKAVGILDGISGKGKNTGFKCDVSDLSQVEAFADAAAEQFGNIDIWINNAGVNQPDKYIWELEEKEIDFLLNIDIKGTVNGSSAAVRKMIKQGNGAIYNVEGMGSNDAFQPCLSMYGTAKRAVTYFTDALANEIKVKKLPVIACKLSPGIMITDFLTSSNGKTGNQPLSEKHKKVYNILGDKPDVIAEFLTERILKNTKNGIRINWLTNGKAAFRFMTAGFNKRDFFSGK